jgi:D-alanyl-lipoteichoic acid acyltransferase DltB (MBOAT superfamily)
MMKKLLIADPLKPIVDQAYASPELYSGPALLVASYCFAFQLYCDFAGYSDIAIGAARILGFDVIQNFRLPYFATTVRDFWRRWHISLSNWLRDYIYISLGGNKKGIVLIYANIMITMILCGLWHGASWPFIFWGTAHGVLLCCSRITLPFRDSIYKSLGFTPAVVNIIRALITFHLISVLWIFFRAETIDKALEIIGRIIHGEDGLMVPYLLPLILIPFFLLTEAISSKTEVIEHLIKYPRFSRIIIYASIILLIAVITATPQTGFLYFAF